jgi:hypothetical protein
MLTRHARYRIRVTDHGWSSEEVVAILEDRTTFDSSLKRHHLYRKHDNGRQTSTIESCRTTLILHEDN